MMTTLLRPLITRSLWLDVLRQAVAGFISAIDRVTDSMPVLIRILIASTGVALSSVFLLIIYPILNPETQHLALIMTGLVWYISLAQIETRHEVGVFSYITYLTVIVPTAIVMMSLGIPHVVVAPALAYGTFAPAMAVVIAMYVAVRLTYIIINTISNAFSEDRPLPERPLTQSENEALTLARSQLADDASLKDRARFGLSAVGVVIVGLAVLSLLTLIPWPFNLASITLGLALLGIGFKALNGVIIQTQLHIWKETAARRPPRMREIPSLFGPLSVEEKRQHTRLDNMMLVTAVIFVASFMGVFLSAVVLSAYHNNDVVGLLIVSMIILVASWVALDYLKKAKLQFIDALKAARAT